MTIITYTGPAYGMEEDLANVRLTPLLEYRNSFVMQSTRSEAEYQIPKSELTKVEINQLQEALR